MDRRLFEHIADKIQRHRTWIKVEDTNAWFEFILIVNGRLKKCPFRVLTLQSFRVKQGFTERRKWYVSEYDLSKAVVALIKKDPKARRRIHHYKLTLHDVEFVIEKATFGNLKLDLDKYEL